MKLAPLIIATAFADKKSAAFERIAKAEEHDYDAANWLDAEFGTTGTYLYLHFFQIINIIIKIILK